MNHEKIYKVIWEKKAHKMLDDLPKKVKEEIENKVNNHLALDPWGLGERYTGDWKGFWKYRIRDYRVKYVIYEEKVVITVFEVFDRKELKRRK